MAVFCSSGAHVLECTLRSGSRNPPVWSLTRPSSTPTRPELNLNKPWSCFAAVPDGKSVPTFPGIGPRAPARRPWSGKSLVDAPPGAGLLDDGAPADHLDRDRLMLVGLAVDFVVQVLQRPPEIIVAEAMVL